MPKAILKFRAAPYYVDEMDAVTGQQVRRERLARRGEEIDFSDQEYARLKSLGALLEPADQQVAADIGDPNATVETSSAQDLAEWLKESKPTVDETVDAADDDPDVATKLLEAENLATGGQPRKGVVDGLTAIIEKDEPAPPTS